MTKTKLESDYKKLMVDSVNAAGGYARRIEDQYGVGILDLVFSMPETGLILAEAKRFTGNFFEPSGRQYIEMMRVDDGGGVALLIGVKEGRHYLHGTNRDDAPRGRAWAKDCIVQLEGESFSELLTRWYNEVVKYV